eukprot:TRINITY_DN10428_c0_g1_i1.p1 TRINITY_DN10428_c0_g1~~TRINITY_DN10428_c0_g1_i1.p1  ORF type:complete len:113 (+),score=30.60 TRINITY_DN10428_c0_g1_i1:126-464(+)
MKAILNAGQAMKGECAGAEATLLEVITASMELGISGLYVKNEMGAGDALSEQGCHELADMVNELSYRVDLAMAGGMNDTVDMMEYALEDLQEAGKRLREEGKEDEALSLIHI